jgi:diguanylate cyclase (GGDEF)-like protein
MGTARIRVTRMHSLEQQRTNQHDQPHENPFFGRSIRTRQSFMTPESADAKQEQLLSMRHALVDRVWQGLAVVALVGAPASISRTFSTGWMALYGVHIGVAVLVLAVYWFRARLSFVVKSVLIVVILWAIGLAGALTLGILGSGYWWLVLSSLLVSTLFSIRAGIICAVAVTAILAATGAGFVSGALKVTVDPNVYIVSATSWVTLVIATIVTPFIVFLAIAAYQRTTLVLLDEVHKQRDAIQQLATHDQLTGLPALHLAADRLHIALEAARRSGKKVALMFIDLDGFKKVNDGLGHEAGDQVLKEVAARLLKAVRSEDTAARIGGDEFIAILGALEDGQMAGRIAERAIGLISAPIDYGGKPISVGASIGIGLFPDHADDAQTLRRVADVAMYAVKLSGKNGFAYGLRDEGASASVTSIERLTLPTLVT